MRTFALATLVAFVGLSAAYAENQQGMTEATPPAQRETPMMKGMMGGMMGRGMMEQMSRMMENCNKMMESHLQRQQQPPQNR